MKNFKKILSVVLSVVFVVCILTFASSADELGQIEDAKVSVAQYIANFWETYSAQIMSGASVLFAFVLCIFFKKGLIPTVNKFLNIWEIHAKKSAEMAETASNNAEQLAQKLMAKFDEYAEKNTKQIELYDELVDAQIKMIGKLLLNLRLSADQKQQIDECMTDVKIIKSKTHDAVEEIMNEFNTEDVQK